MAWPKGMSRKEFFAQKAAQAAQAEAAAHEMMYPTHRESPTLTEAVVRATQSKSAVRAYTDMKAKQPTWRMKAGNNWETGTTDAEDSPDEFHIARDAFPENMDLQWWTREIYGQETKQRLNTAARSGWTPVHDSDFDNWHKRVLGGKYALDDGGYIVHKSCVLMARPESVSERARERDKKRAMDVIAAKEAAFKGGEINATGADHPSARAHNRITRTMERIDIPRD